MVRKSGSNQEDRNGGWGRDRKVCNTDTVS